MTRILSAVMLTLCLVLTGNTLFAQVDTASGENNKEGWTFGAVPAIAFDSDVGFRYGAIVNFYDFGDGTIYPDYRHSIYLEWSRTTKGSGVNMFTYDSKYLIPGVRLTAEASLLTEQALDFYGFNGAEATYYAAYEDEDSADYISRMYYRHERKLLRLKADFQGPIMNKDNSFRWFAGFAHYGSRIATVDIDKLNEGKDSVDMLPQVNTLYDNYIDWGIIPQDQAEGGSTNFLKLGLIRDTRDNEPNPNKGIWTEGIVYLAPGFLGNDYAFGTATITHRQYFTLMPNRMTLAYRLGLQAKLFGDMPFYMLPYYHNTLQARDGLGGAKTLRGVLRNRVVGESYYFGNLEVRTKVLKTKLLKQNFYIAVAPFFDIGQTLSRWQFTQTSGPMIEEFDDRPHIGYGAGAYFALNQNFIVAVNYGLAACKSDGDSGLYITLNFLY